MALQNLKKCEKCPLSQYMSFGPLYSQGNITSKLFIIGDFPTNNDALVDELYSDHIGLLFKKIIKDADIESYYLTTLLKCVPIDNKIKIANLKQCTSWLEQELDYIKPNTIILLGNEVYKLFSRLKLSINFKTIVTKSIKQIYTSGQKEYVHIVDQFKQSKEISLGFH